MDKKSSFLVIALLAVTGLKAQVQTALNYPIEDIKVILRSIAEQNNLNIYIPDTLKSTVTLRAVDLPYPQLFDALLAGTGYTWTTTKDGLVLIDKLPQVSYIYPLLNAPPQHIMDEIKPYLQLQEAISSAPSAVVLTVAPERYKYLSGLISSFDIKKRQLQIECRFQEVTKGTSRKLGIDWTKASSNTLTMSSVKLNLNPQEDEQSYTATLSSTDAALLFSALDNDLRTRTLSNPSIIAEDNTTATVSVGQQYPLPQYEFSKDTGNLTVSGFTYKDIGVLLTVKPQFIGTDKCLITLTPEVSSVADTLTFGGSGTATIPVISTKKVQTQLTLKDKQTVVISGLIDDKDTKSKSSIPVISRLPLLGKLFSSKDRKNNNTELLIFVTVNFL